MTRELATVWRPSVKRHSSGLLEQAELGHLAAGQLLGDGGGGENPHIGRVAGGAQDKFDKRDIVDDRVGVRHHDHRRDAASRGRRAGRGDRLAMFAARLADEYAAVDQPGNDRLAGAVNAFGAVRRALI